MPAADTPVAATPSASSPTTVATQNAGGLPGGRNPEKATLFYRFTRVVVWLVGKTLFRLEVHGADRIPKAGGVLIVSNHQSNLDPPVLGVGLDRPVAFLAKSQLFEFGPFATLIRALNAFPVRIGAGDVGALRESIRLLQAGWILNVFAEGSRSADGELQPAQKGAGLMIKKAGVPVVPAIVDGTFKAWPRGKLLPRPSKVVVSFGEPVDLSGKKADEIRQWTDDTLASMLADVRSGRVKK